MNFQEFMEHKSTSQIRQQGSASSTNDPQTSINLTSPIQMKVSEQIFGTSAQEVTSSVKLLSEKITQQIQDSHPFK